MVTTSDPPASITLANEAAATFGASPVAVGWCTGFEEALAAMLAAPEAMQALALALRAEAIAGTDLTEERYTAIARETALRLYATWQQQAAQRRQTA